MPINHWHLVEKDKNTDDLALPDGNIADLYDEEMTNRYSTAESMLDSWIGCKGMQTLSDEDIDKNKFYVNLESYGNTSSASVPIALSEAINKKLITKPTKSE